MNETQTLQHLIRRPVYAERFKEILKDRADQFVSSLLQVGASMPDVEPKSILAAAMTAAALDLPINKNLGFAWIVPYADGKSGRKLAQFQMGYKGYIQLGLRTGQYSRMNARLINAEAFIGYDDIGEPIIEWTKLDETKEPVGYCFAWRLVNGFSKLCYWPRSKVNAHAGRYSQAFRKDSGPWKTHPHEMALKTVIKNELAKWGILSVQMERAYREDSAVRADDQSEPQFLDAPEDDLDSTDMPNGGTVPETVLFPATSKGSASSVEATGTGTGASEHKPSQTYGKTQEHEPGPPVPNLPGDESKPVEKPVAIIDSPSADAPGNPSPRPRGRPRKPLEPQSEMPLTPKTEPQTRTTQQRLADGCEKHGISFEQFRKWLIRAGFQDARNGIADLDSIGSFDELPEPFVRGLLRSGEMLYAEVLK